jgi:hypothetical protein
MNTNSISQTIKDAVRNTEKFENRGKNPSSKDGLTRRLPTVNTDGISQTIKDAVTAANKVRNDNNLYEYSSGRSDSGRSDSGRSDSGRSDSERSNSERSAIENGEFLRRQEELKTKQDLVSNKIKEILKNMSNSISNKK